MYNGMQCPCPQTPQTELKAAGAISPTRATPNSPHDSSLGACFSLPHATTCCRPVVFSLAHQGRCACSPLQNDQCNQATRQHGGTGTQWHFGSSAEEALDAGGGSSGSGEGAGQREGGSSTDVEVGVGGDGAVGLDLAVVDLGDAVDDLDTVGAGGLVGDAVDDGGDAVGAGGGRVVAVGCAAGLVGNAVDDLGHAGVARGGAIAVAVVEGAGGAGAGGCGGVGRCDGAEDGDVGRDVGFDGAVVVAVVAVFLAAVTLLAVVVAVVVVAIVVVVHGGALAVTVDLKLV